MSTKLKQSNILVDGTFPWRNDPGVLIWHPLIVGSTISSLSITSPSREQFRKIYKWCVSKMGREFNTFGEPNPEWNVHLKVNVSADLIYDSKGMNQYLGANRNLMQYGTVRFNIESHHAVELKLSESN
jgi:hypothetical protein